MQMGASRAGTVKGVPCAGVTVLIQRLDGRGAGEQVTIPEPAATAGQGAPVERGRGSTVRRRQWRGQVRRQGDDQTTRHFEECTGAMNISRKANVAALVVHDRARRCLRELRQVHQMEAVVLAKSYVRHNQIVRCAAQVCARRFE